MAVVTDAQRANPALAGWVAAKDKENANAKPVTPEQTAYSSAMDQFKANNWGPNGTANGKTESQNLAAVIQQPGNTTQTTATPYIAPNGQTDYHISGQPTNGNTGVAGGVTTPPPPTNSNVGTATPTGMNQAMQALPTYVPPTASGINFDQATNQVKGQIDPMFQRALEALQAQKHQDQLNGDQLGMARGGSHSGLAADLQNKVAIGAAGKAADLDATRQTQIAQMAQALVNRGEDNDYRNQQQKLAEYLGINGLNLQQQGQQADYTGQYNGQQTMQSQNQNFQQGIQQGDLTGWYKGLQTLAGQQQSYNQSPNNPNNVGQNLNNQLTQLQLNDYPAQSQAAAQKTQQDLAAGKISNEIAQYQFDELKNPNSAVNLSQSLDNQIKKIQLDNLPRQTQLELQRLQKEIAQIGVVHTTKQSQADIDMDNLKIQKLTADIEKVKADTNIKNSKGATVNVKTSADNYGVLNQDVNESKDLAEAYNLIEQNAVELTDADYKQLKADARKKFEVKTNKYAN